MAERQREKKQNPFANLSRSDGSSCGVGIIFRWPTQAFHLVHAVRLNSFFFGSIAQPSLFNAVVLAEAVLSALQYQYR